MPEEDYRRMPLVAELICDHISLDGIDRYHTETGILESDFAVVQPIDFPGEIFAVDGSNVPLCSWSTASVNLIRAGYAVYKRRVWRRTVVTFDDVLLADPMLFKEMFDPYLKRFFGLKGIDLKESDLDRLSSYFRELQEYVAIDDAISEAHAGDIILYDGSFDVFEPMRGVLATIFARAREKNISLLAVAKSSSLSWGQEISLPFVLHTAMAGCSLLPDEAWFLSLKDKKIDAGCGKWNGQTYIVRFCTGSWRAFRVDAPSYLAGDIAPVLGKLASFSCSAECPGYPHALFRAHRDIRITEQEKAAARQRLIMHLLDRGLSHSEVMILTQDFHDILETKSGI